jgi:tartrate dehydratase alpha subunit/fumarate hydratase class I-like protein
VLRSKIDMTQFTTVQDSVTTNLSRLVVYLPPETKEKLEKLATYERRSLSQMSVYAIEEAIRKAEAEGKISTDLGTK